VLAVSRASLSTNAKLASASISKDKYSNKEWQKHNFLKVINTLNFDHSSTQARPTALPKMTEHDPTSCL
jgi:hypothetical protein